MGQQANNRGRRATLDEQKKRAAGRSQNTPEREAIKDAVGMGKNQPVSGAHGRGGVANRKGGGGTQGAGRGGGGAASDALDASITTGRSTRRARRRT